MKKLNFIGFLIFVIILSSYAYAADPVYTHNIPDIKTFEGKGKQVLEPFDVVEGTLSFHILSKTSCESCSFSVGFDHDNNLDGTFGGSGDYTWSSVFDEGYESIKNVDENVDVASSGGKIRISIDGVGADSATWKLEVKQQPSPTHSIEVGVFDKEYENGASWEGIIENAKVIIIGPDKKEYPASGFSTYGKAHYYFDNKFFGYEDYAIKVSAPGYKEKEVKISLKDWTSLGFPGWPLYLKVYLEKAGTGSIYCIVKDKATKSPIENAKVIAKDSFGNSVERDTNSKGECSFSLAEGTYTLTAGAKGYKEKSVQADAVSTTAEPVIFELEKGSTGIYGTVKDSWAGYGIPNVALYLYGRDNNNYDEEIQRTKSNEKGEYSFQDLKAGKYEVIPGDLLEKRFKVHNGKLVTLKEYENKKVDLELIPKSVDVAGGFDVEPGKAKNAVAGEEYKVDFTISNNGPMAAKDVKLRINLESDLEEAEFIKVISSKGTCSMNANEIKCNLGKIKKNGVEVIRITAKAKRTGSFTMNSIIFDSPEEKWEERDWLPLNNKDKLEVKVRPYKVIGKVEVPSPSPFLFGASLLPLKNIKVILHVGDKTYKNHTDEEGSYSFRINDTTENFWVEVPVEDEGKNISVRSRKGFNRQVVDLKTKKFEFDGKRTDILFSFLYNSLAPSMTLDQRKILQDAGIFYYNTYKAVEFAKNKLKIKFNHKLPVEIYLYEPGCFACYHQADSHIQTGTAFKDSSAWATDSPDNREFHEFGHHVNADSRMGGENKIPELSSVHDSNHGGVKNTDSIDSVEEGFAEFFSLLIKGNAFYRWSNKVTNLERNYHKDHGKPDEEFNFASLLWDLVDKNADHGNYEGDKQYKDYVSMDLDKLWKILDSPNIKTVSSVYTELKKVIGKQDSNKADGVTDLDALFIMHSFYSDKNDNGIYDKGEIIGNADFWTHTTPPRKKRPDIPGTALSFTVKDKNGNNINASIFNVSVYFPGGEGDFSYKTWKNPDDGFLWLLVPEDALRIEVSPEIAGYESEPYVETNKTFWEKVDKAQKENKSVYDSNEFIVKENGIKTPARFTAEPASETEIDLKWKASGNVILVRGVDHYPSYVEDGDVIYKGDKNSFEDKNLLGNVNYLYSLFKEEGGKVSVPARAHAVTVPPKAEERNYNYLHNYSSIILIAVALLLVFILLKIKKGKKHKSKYKSH